MGLMQKAKGLVDGKLLKFIIVGVINTLVGSAIMFGLYNFAGCSYWISSAANYILTSILSFFLINILRSTAGAGRGCRWSNLQ